MRKAWDHFQYLFDFTYVGFDSFEGLPEIAEIDKQPIWQKGKLAFAEECFIKRVLDHGMPRHKLKTFKGFYDTSLSEDLKASLLPSKAAVIYIDCDLYTSTVPVLEFIVDFLQVGTVIVFDDWYCFYGDPQRGEQLAWGSFGDAILNFVSPNLSGPMRPSALSTSVMLIRLRLPKFKARAGRSLVKKVWLI